MIRPRPTFAELGLASTAWALGALLFRWDVISTGFRKVGTSAGDGRAVVFLLEHWLGVFSGELAWRDPGQYFPARGTLGYYDAHFLQALLYVPLRLLGIEPYLAFQIEQFELSAIGFGGFWLLSRRLLRAPIAATLIGSLLFTFGSSLHASTSQSQLFAIYFVPWLCLAAAHGCAVTDRPRAAVAWSSVAGLGYALLLYTSFYIGWLLALAAVVLAGSLVVVDPSAARRLCRSHRRRLAIPTLAFVLGWLAGIVPFAVTYLPVIVTGRSQRLADVMRSVGKPTDVINVGAANLFWGRLLEDLPAYPLDRLRDPNLYRTITPLVLGTVIAGGIASFVARRQAGLPSERRALAAIALTVLVLLLLPMSLGGHSVWPLLWQWVPGGKAIRFVWRLQLVNAALTAAAVTMILSWLLRRGASSSRPPPKSKAAALLLGALLLAEQINTDDWAEIDRHAEHRLLATIPPPPAECRAFAMVDDVGVVRVPNAFALTVARHLRLPSMNGLEGPLYPDARVEVVDRRTLLARARHVLERFGWPSGICVLDLPARRWDTRLLAEPLFPTLRADTRLHVGRGGEIELLAQGWSFPEDWGTWSVGRRAVLRFRLPEGSTRATVLCADVGAFVYGKHRRQEAIVAVRQRELARWLFEDAARRVEELTIPPELVAPGGAVEVMFTNLAPTSPRAVGMSEDERELGISLAWISVHQAAGGAATRCSSPAEAGS